MPFALTHISLSYFKNVYAHTQIPQNCVREKLHTPLQKNLQKTAKARKILFTHPRKLIKHCVYFVFGVNC